MQCHQRFMVAADELLKVQQETSRGGRKMYNPRENVYIKHLDLEAMALVPTTCVCGQNVEQSCKCAAGKTFSGVIPIKHMYTSARGEQYMYAL